MDGRILVGGLLAGLAVAGRRAGQPRGSGARELAQPDLLTTYPTVASLKASGRFNDDYGNLRDDYVITALFGGNDGLNADWSASAWSLGEWDLTLVDEEDHGGFSILQRFVVDQDMPEVAKDKGDEYNDAILDLRYFETFSELWAWLQAGMVLPPFWRKTLLGWQLTNPILSGSKNRGSSAKGLVGGWLTRGNGRLRSGDVAPSIGDERYTALPQGPRRGWKARLQEPRVLRDPIPGRPGMELWPTDVMSLAADGSKPALRELKSRFPYWRAQEHLDAALIAGDRLQRTAKSYQRAMDKALQEHGDHGSMISGVGRDHFPRAVKEDLRFLLQRINRWERIGEAHRLMSGRRKPLGVQASGGHYGWSF